MAAKKIVAVDQATGVKAQTTLALGDLSDVTIVNPAVDQFLRNNGAGWVNSEGIATSASKGVGFFYDGTVVIATGTNNANLVEALTKVPWVAAEVVKDYSVNSSTVLANISLHDTALGRTDLAAGAWIFSTYCSVNLAAGISELLLNVMRVRIGAGTVTTTASDSTHRIATASIGTPFAAELVDIGAVDAASYLRTPQGVYQITTRTDDTHIIILVPSTYANESAVEFSVHKRLFQATTGEVNNTDASPYPNLQLYTTNSVQPAYAILATDKLAVYQFAKTDSAVTKHLYVAYGGTLRYSRMDTPLATLHGDLAGKQGGAGAVPAEEYYHLTAAEHTIATTVATDSLPGYMSAADHTTFNAKLSDAPADSTIYGRKDNAWIAASGTNSDLLSTLTAAEVSVTTTANLTAGLMHVCSGTSSDYTVTLPAVASSTGKLVGIRIAPACTKLVTVKGNSAELIDTVNTRVMWANESAVLYCDGTTWTKIAGKTLPMHGCMVREGSGTYQTLTGSLALNTLTMVSTLIDVGGMAVIGSHKFTTRRAGNYLIIAQVGLKADAPSGTRNLLGIQVGATYYALAEDDNVASTGPIFQSCVSAIRAAAAATDIVAVCQVSSASTTYVEHAMISIEEIISW